MKYRKLGLRLLSGDIMSKDVCVFRWYFKADELVQFVAFQMKNGKVRKNDSLVDTAKLLGVTYTILKRDIENSFKKNKIYG